MHLSTDTLITTDSFQISAKGLMFDKVYGEQPPNVSIPSMPNFDASLPSAYQNFVSTYSMDSFANAILEVEPIAFWYKSPTLTTSKLNAFLPGIESYYGDVPVNVHVSIQALGNFTVTEANP